VRGLQTRLRAAVTLTFLEQIAQTFLRDLETVPYLAAAARILDLGNAPEADRDGAGQRRVVTALFVVSDGLSGRVFFGTGRTRKQVDWSAGLD
jgi:hypothetical protein